MTMRLATRPLWDKDECGCGHPNSHPPCGYCENGEYSLEDEWEYPKASEYMVEYCEAEREYVYAKTTQATKSWEQRYYDAEYKLEQIRKEGIEKHLQTELKEIREELQKDLYNEVWDDLYPSVLKELQDKVYKDHYLDIKEKLEATARAEIIAEVREELIQQMKNAQDKI